MVERIRLGELLVKAGVLDDFQLRSALLEQQRRGSPLGRILVHLGYLDETLLVKALSKQLGIPRAHLQTLDIPLDILKRIDPDDAQSRSYCPERFEEGVLTVAMSDPTNVEAADEIAFRTGLRVRPTIAGETEVRRGLQQLYDAGVDLLAGFPAGADTGPFAEIDLPEGPPEPVVRRSYARSNTPRPPRLPSDTGVSQRGEDEEDRVTMVSPLPSTAARAFPSLAGSNDSISIAGEARPEVVPAPTLPSTEGSAYSGGRAERFGALPGHDERFGALPGHDERFGALPGHDERFGALPGHDERFGALPGHDERFGALPGHDERFGALPGHDERFGALSGVSEDACIGGSSALEASFRGGVTAAERGSLGDLSTGTVAPLSSPGLIEVPEFSREELVVPSTLPEPSIPEKKTDLNVIAAKLQAAQKRQNRAIRVMIDMLIESGVFTEDEFRTRLGLHRSRSRNRR